MIWTIINTIGPWIVIALALYNNHLQKKTQRLYEKMLDELDKQYETIAEAFEAQTEFNGSAVDNIERHEEALKIIVNHIKAGEE